MSYEGLDYEEQAVSENATWSILAWLRTDGCARHESGIWGHEWFDVLEDSDEDGGDGEAESGGHGDKETVRVEQWMLEGRNE